MRKCRPDLHQFKNSLGVDVIIEDIESNPQCSHGPSILFERYTSSGDSKRFFACSACRDRKKCSFYVEEEERKYMSKRSAILPKENSSLSYSLKLHYKHYKKFSELNGKDSSKLSFCSKCSTLVNGDDHNDCSAIYKLVANDFYFPTKFMTPKEDAKCEAQYLFSDKSVSTILNITAQVNACKFLCIGAPRIHEAIAANHSHTMRSLLLDFDDRFAQFFSPQEYIFYNLFNHHFFGGSEAKDIYYSFLKGPEELVVVMDPPFGGRVELIANTIRMVELDWRKCNEEGKLKDHLPVFLIFPYFLEATVKSALPKLFMLDYMVDYINHPLYTKGPKGMKNGSAVRIFTNVSSSEIDLSMEAGYRYCILCRRWVYEANVHCNECGGCMGKDGRSYKHCAKCARCVKPSWIHCNNCNRCQQQDHRCLNKKDKQLGVCHSCGGKGHKRRECSKQKLDEGKDIPPRKKKKHWSAEEEKNHVISVLEQVLS